MVVPGNGIASFEELLRDVTVATFDGTVSGALTEPESRDLFAECERKGWQKGTEARCDFESKPRMTRRSGIWFVSLWQKSVYGRTLTEIKGDVEMQAYFAQHITAHLRDMLGGDLHAGGWAICTTPKRRHKEKNFATLVSVRIGELLGIPFYEDATICKTRQRVGAEFEANNIPQEPNVILFDDFVTTGQTMAETQRLLKDAGKTIMCITGINNKL